MGRWNKIIIVALITFGFASTAEARSGREKMVPHGSQIGCPVCHTGGSNGLNDFGFDSANYLQNGVVNWAGLSQIDSDHDGYTNGEELGDPNGTWQMGDPAPSGQFSMPGDKNDSLCGDGNVQSSEDCEVGNLGGATCASLGLNSGTLGCNTMCKFDTSGCDTCGDGQVQGSEQCDGTNLGGATCQSLGKGTGTLACNGCSYDTSGCSMGDAAPTPDTCGDGVRQSSEDCEGSDLGGQTCSTLGYDGGVLDCHPDCSFDTDGCLGTPPPTSPSTSDPSSSSPSGSSSSTSTASENDFGGGSTTADNKIVMEGRACSTTPARPAAGTGLLALLFGVVLFGRRRRD